MIVKVGAGPVREGRHEMTAHVALRAWQQMTNYLKEVLIPTGCQDQDVPYGMAHDRLRRVTSPAAGTARSAALREARNHMSYARD